MAIRGARGAAWALAAALAAGAVALGLSACSSEAGAEEPRVAVTTPMLGSIVREVVGGAAEVEVVMPDGADPHEYQPSARDARTLRSADLVVVNGLGLEEGLGELLRRIEDDGVPVFAVTDHVALRDADEPDEGHAEEEGAHEEDDHGARDPHVWMDPLAMRGMVAALAPVLHEELGVDVSERAADLRERLEALHRETAELLAGVPPERRKLVTGHESMGYFADRYGFEIVGAIVPSLSSQAQVSAGDLARLRAQVAREGVPAVIAEPDTPPEVARAVAAATDARVVEIATHTLPDDGSYLTFMRQTAARIAEGLGAGGGG